MKKVIGVFLLLVSSVFIFSCADEQPEIETRAAFSIEFGAECGWCAGHEYVKINSQKIQYTRIIPCGENKSTETDSRGISEHEWQILKSSFNYEHFTELDYNECNLCADGCDEIISITDAGETHTIRYDPELDIEEIQQLQTKLRELMQEFRTEN